LFVLRSANMQSTSDQQFVKNQIFTNYIMNRVIAIRKTGAVSVACVGGIYSGATKSGDAFVPSSQSWINLSGSGKLVTITDFSLAIADAATAIPYLSLTTGSTGACTADIFIFGDILD